MQIGILEECCKLLGEEDLGMYYILRTFYEKPW